MTTKNVDNFVKDRDEALLSLDRKKIEKYMKKYGIPKPPKEIFWVSVHKARCEIDKFPKEEKQKSMVWLVTRGYFPGIGMNYD